jgi:hypothetical protein
MDIYHKSLTTIKWVGVACTILFASMNAAYSHTDGHATKTGYRQHVNLAYYHGGYHRYGYGYRGYRTGYGYGWRRGYWGGAYVPGVVTYRNRCVWIPRHINRFGNVVRGHCRF